MMQTRVSRRLVFGGLAIALLANAQATAATRYMGGHGAVKAPQRFSGAFPELGPYRVSTMAPNDGTATTATTVGNAFTLPAGALQTSKMQLRDYRDWPAFAQQSISMMTSQPFAERFEAGRGAAASGPIDFCPPSTNPDPFAGNLSCLDAHFPGAGNLTLRIGIDRRRTGGGQPIGNAFGGTLRLARSIGNQNTLWIALPPYIPWYLGTGIQRVSKVEFGPTGDWTPGLSNFAFQTEVIERGPQYSAMLTREAGMIEVLSAGPFPPTGAPHGTNRGWGFRMTTGVVSGSDASEFPLSWITTGSDTVTPNGQLRNIVLVSGGITTSGFSGVSFPRVQVLEVALAVPEPATIAGLCIGLAGLLAMARTRRP